jgi:GNAT superfamily N-acetyltransferase
VDRRLTDFRIASIEGEPARRACDEILASLPDWFGIPEANTAYADFCAANETWAVIGADDRPVAIISGRRHFPECAEIELMAVRPEHHRHGLGSLLVATFEQHHAAAGVRMIEVKTLGPSHSDEGYAATRRFYLAAGFVPIEETWMWGPDNPALILVRPIG